MFQGWGGLDGGGWWRFWRGTGEVGELAKVWMGLKKVGNVHRRFPEVNEGECSWKRRAREEVIGGMFILAAMRTDRGRGFVNPKLEGLESGAI